MDHPFQQPTFRAIYLLPLPKEPLFMHEPQRVAENRSACHAGHNPDRFREEENRD
jgi:hypothetical protein